MWMNVTTLGVPWRVDSGIALGSYFHKGRLG
jgi:hypothetical protein